jgi:hypothetical protein
MHPIPAIILSTPPTPSTIRNTISITHLPISHSFTDTHIPHTPKYTAYTPFTTTIRIYHHTYATCTVPQKNSTPKNIILLLHPFPHPPFPQKNSTPKNIILLLHPFPHPPFPKKTQHLKILYFYCTPSPIPKKTQHLKILYFYCILFPIPHSQKKLNT